MAGVAEIYRLGGIAFASEIPLPELSLWEEKPVPPDAVSIRLGSLPAYLPEAIEVDPDCFATPSKYFLRIPGIAKYLVSGGMEVVVEPDEHAAPLDVRAYLLGTVFTVVCHQRGLLPLHASAVDCGKGVAAFLASSGQGKSSLAACLALRGFPIIADDICLVDPRGEELARVIPTAPWLKLWRASFENLGWQTDGLERVFSEDDKYRLPLPKIQPVPSIPDDEEREFRPIRELIFLECGEAGSQVEVREMSRLEAIPLLMNLTHQSYLLEAIGEREDSFRRCSKVLSQARAYRLIRPWGFEHMNGAIEIVESFLLQKTL